ncbi:hypothetical protein FRC00_006461 [Tulasnella sp. 408]|nr:hypothetical protein FRC00_006461 [Tulasnella sp. 408]
MPIPTPSEEPGNEPRARTLVLCFNDARKKLEHGEDSNVVLLCQMLQRNDPRHQHFYYQAGIGTYASTGFTSKIRQALDEAFAWSLEDRVVSPGLPSCITKADKTRA